MPRSTFDHHIQCGNSLVGAAPDLLRQGIPDDAYKPLSGDDKTLASDRKKQNRNAPAKGASLNVTEILT